MFFALIAFLVGALALWSAWHSYRIMRDARRWPTVSGTFVERGVGARMGRGSYAPHVRYAYRVNGKDYVGAQFYLTARVGSTATKIQKLVDGLPNPVQVHYDPAKPDRSYLLDTPAWTYWTMGIGGIVALLIGLVYLVDNSLR